ncbi:MAG: molybdopterin dinucleotide binding domain-containing protein, partial [Mucilaginibacter sp.]
FVEKNKHEFAEPLPIEEVLSGAGLASPKPRRDFLKALGFGVGAVTLAACQKVPVHKSIPYLIKPEEVTPGIANYYTSTHDGHAILVKTREGRPIKVEGNPNDALSGGGLSAQSQASVLDLYDNNRVKDPQLNGGDTGWDHLDAVVKSHLAATQSAGKGIRIISSTVHSPSTQAVIADFITKYPATKHINYDAYSYSGIIQANQQSFGKAVVPHYNFDKADVIVSFAADFLGSWISGEEFTKQYVSNRNMKSLEEKKMSRHIQFEAGMSMTGTNADTRIPIKLSEEGLGLIALYNAISGTTLPGTKKLTSANADKAIVLAAKELVAAKGKALVVCGSNSTSKQVLVNAINALLGSYGTTIDLDNPTNQYKGNDAEFVAFVEEAKKGTIGAAIFLDANPVYDYFDKKGLKAALSKIKLKVSFSDRADETAAACNAVAPNHHYLESWGDDSAISGFYTVVQPTINPVYNTRQAEQSLLVWSDNAVQDYYTYVRNNWTNNLLALGGLSGEAGWESLLQAGLIKTTPKAASTTAFAGDVSTAAQNVSTNSAALAAPEDKIEVQLYQNTAIGDGRNANNPWLQELPDAVSKVTWDNYAAIAPKYAEKLGLEEGDVVKIEANGYAVEVPVLFQPGQAPGTVSVAVGYGRTHAGLVGNGVGANVYPFSSFRGGSIHKAVVATLSKTGDVSPLAQTQTHHSFEGRDVIRETTFKEYLKDPASESGHAEHHKMYDLWENSKFDKPVYDWKMAIDLNACTGCGACIVACSAENNIPVVGKDEVRRRREMHWIRIDRYYSFNSNGKSITKEKEIDKLVDMNNVS